VGFCQGTVGIQSSPRESSVLRDQFQTQQDLIAHTKTPRVTGDPHPFDFGISTIAKRHPAAPDSFAIHPRNKERTRWRRIGSISGRPAPRPVKPGCKAAIYFTEISIQTDDSIRVRDIAMLEVDLHDTNAQSVT